MTAEDLYDELRIDIQSSHKQLSGALEKTLAWCARQGEESSLCASVAKTLAVTALLKDFSATPFNVAALMQRNLAVALTEQKVTAILARMAEVESVPVSEDGKEAYVFLTEKQIALDEERRRYQPYQSDVTKLVNTIVKEIFSPLNFVQTADGLKVKVSLWMHSSQAALTEPGAPLRQDVVFYSAGERKNYLKEAESDSRQNANRLLFLAEWPAKWGELADDILRSQHMAESHGQDAEMQVRDYAQSQLVKSERDRKALKKAFENSLNVGEIVIGGTIQAVQANNFNSLLRDELKKLANDTFSKRYLIGKKEAQTDTAIRFLKSDPGVQSDARCDPLQLVRLEGQQQPTLMANLVVSEIQNWIENQSGQVSGARIYEHFQEAPYGWSSEIVLYVLAAIFWAGRVDFFIAGHRYESRCSAVLEAMQAPNKFKNVGVAPRMTKVTDEDLVKAGTYLVNLGMTGVVYTLDGIASAKQELGDAKKTKIVELLARVRENKTYGEERLQTIEKTTAMFTEWSVSDFVNFVKNTVRSEQFTMDMNWLTELLNAEAKGLFDVVQHVRRVIPELSALTEEFVQEVTPSKEEVEKWLNLPNFSSKTVDLKRFCSSAEGAISKAQEFWRQEIDNKNCLLKEKVRSAIADRDLSLDEAKELQSWQQNKSAPVTELMSTVELLRIKSELSDSIGEVNDEVRRILQQRPVPKEKRPRKVSIAHRVTTMEELDQLINTLLRLKEEMDYISEIEVTVQ